MKFPLRPRTNLGRGAVTQTIPRWSRQTKTRTPRQSGRKDAPSNHALTDPVAARASWDLARGTAPGPLFTSMRNRRVILEPLSGDAVARMLRTRARGAGLAAERITGHSLRAGHATEAALAGVGIDRIAAQTRHRRLSTLLERYIRPAQALQLTSSRDLGL
jgi:integrase